MKPDSRARKAWVRERRRATIEQFDVLDSPIYDREWGHIGPVHRDFVLGLVDRCPAGATILDAACGTGKYFDLVLSRGRRVVGFDQSRGMLAKAQEKYPGMPLAVVGLQELAVRRPFEGTMCVDALECLPPEDWPEALRNLARATVSGGTVYLTVERTTPEILAEAERSANERGIPAVPGELIDDPGAGAYHFYPTKTALRGWLSTAGLSPVREQDDEWAPGEGYWHLLCRVTEG